MTTTPRLGFDIMATDKTGAAFNSAKKLMEQLQAAQKAANGFAGPLRQSESAAARFGSRIQNVSFQISDFAVQVGSGTDATRALAQQLPQLLGGFGTFGAVAGAAVAIVLPLAQALGKTRDYAKELESGLGSLDDAQKVLKTSIVDLTEEYGKFAVLVRDVAKVRETLANAQIAKALVDEMNALQQVNEARVAGKAIATEMVKPLDDGATAAARLIQKFGLSAEAARGLAEPLRTVVNGLQNLNTDAASLGLKQMSQWMEKNNELAREAIPLFDMVKEKWSALSKIKPAATGSMGFSFTPVTEANTYVNSGGDAKVAEQLAANEKALADAKRAAAEATRLAAEAQRKETSEYEQFIATLQRGVTPVQQLQNTIREARENFDRFGAKLNPDQFAGYITYVTDLNQKLEDLTFRKKWDEMAKGIQTATDAMAPFRDALVSVGSGLQDNFVNGMTDAFTSFISGTESAKDALRSFAASFTQEMSAMILKAMALYAVQRLIGLASGSGAFGSLMQSFGGVYGNGLLSNANGNAFSGGHLIPFARGGVVGGPTLFPMVGGMGLMGEAGAEAIMPLERRNGKLGVSGVAPIIHIHNHAGAEVRTGMGPDGSTQIEIVRKVVSEDFARGGPISQQLERNFALRRAGR